VLRAEQTNSSLLYEGKLIFKLFRLVDEGINPDLEMSRFLTERTSFANAAPFAGGIEYRSPGQEAVAVGVLHGFVPNQGDAWRYTLDSLDRYFERALAQRQEIEQLPPTPDSLAALAMQDVPELLAELIGGMYLEMASVLGQRTAELHLALSCETQDPAFAPEPFSLLYQKSLYQSMRGLTRNVMAMLRDSATSIPEELREESQQVLSKEREMLQRFRSVSLKKIPAMKIRIHGDYHLGQVLYTGNDFVIIDFEGEPARTLSERRLKRSPLRDIAGMIRSFHYAAYTSLSTAAREIAGVEERDTLSAIADLWYKYVSAVFLRSYLDTVGEAPLVPADREDFNTLLKTFMLEKAIYELGYELNNRPDWVRVPLAAIAELLHA
jgi:maltose alpha-D-glucosyltransferase/alpha-amylase